jgi:orotidine-5'-phosphate decarboxylase
MKPNKLIVALDVDTVQQARTLAKMLSGVAGMFKIGSQLFTAAGPDFVRELIKGGDKVFLDLKFHDIPNTVAAAGREATRLGVSIFNVHAAGGSEMMKRTAEAIDETAAVEGLCRPTIIAVTILTSANDATLAEIGFAPNPAALVGRLALMAEASGLEGVVASPREVAIVRAAVNRPDFIIVTPGVRPAGATAEDQKRVATPREAVAAGADYIVVGRPIIQARDPARAAQDVIDEIETAVANSHY